MSSSKRSLVCLAIMLALPSLALAQKGTKGAPPVVSSIAPTSTIAGGPNFTLTVTGLNFATGSIVLWSGNSLTTTYVSATQLQATIPAGLIAAAGPAQIAVYTPGRSGGTSNLKAFTIDPATTTTTTTQTTPPPPAPLAITTVSLPAGTTGTSYSQTLAASGGTPSYTWSAISGAVPTGLALSAAGALSGTPSAAGTYAFTVQVRDSVNATASMTYSVSIAAATTPPLAISTASVPGGTAGATYSTNLAATGGTSPYTWGVAPGSSLPPGLAISAAGVISGTPSTAATYAFSIQVSDTATTTSTHAYSLTVAAPAPPPPPPPTTTCNSPYGNCSDPYEGGAFVATGKTALSACGSLAEGRSYYLTGNVGSDPAAICFPLAKGATLDLRGYTVTGRMDMTGYNANGITIFNGTVNCSVYPTPAACIKISSPSLYSARTRLHHLTVHNSAAPGTAAMAAILFDWAGLDGTNVAIEVDHVSGYVQTAPSSSRAAFMRITTAKKVDIHHNDLACNADVAACNLIEAVSPEGYVNGTIRENLLTIAPNLIAGGMPRAITISGPDSSAIGTQGWRVYSNYCTANNGRCFRFRQVNDLVVYSNTVVNCAATQGYGCYHLADPSNGTAYVGNAAALIYNETIQLDTRGVAFWLRDGNGWTVKDLTVVGIHGKLAGIDAPIQAPPGGPVPTSATFCNAPGASALDTASTAPVNTTVNVFNAGNWPVATGTVTVLPSCP